MNSKVRLKMKKKQKKKVIYIDKNIKDEKDTFLTFYIFVTVFLIILKKISNVIKKPHFISKFSPNF